MRQGHKDKHMMAKGTGTLYRIVVRSELSDRYAVAFEGVVTRECNFTEPETFASQRTA
jgi:hypothetical protein